jgi:hypothetical protein
MGSNLFGKEEGGGERWVLMFLKILFEEALSYAT